jgi:hypothetical protein
MYPIEKIMKHPLINPLLQRGGRDLKKIPPEASLDRSGRGGQNFSASPTSLRIWKVVNDG